MKKYFIIFIILFILMGVFSMDILGRSITDIQRRMVDQTNYRINVVKGIVATVNINRTFGCYIAGETVIYPTIPTFSRDPKLQIGDEVTIEFINGCRETPVILAPEDIRERPDTTSPITGIHYALIVTGPNEFQLFDMDGGLIKQAAATGWAYGGCSITVDSEGNIYTDEDYDTFKKYDSDLNLLITLPIENPANWIEGINIGSDGYLYSLEGIAAGYNIKKRSLADLTIQAVIPITIDPWDTHSGGVCLDSDGNFYCVGDNDDIVKYNSAGALLASIDVGSITNEYAGCAVLGDKVYFVKGTSKIVYLPLDLSSYIDWNLPSSIAYALTVADGHLILSGWDGDGDGATSKYDSDRNLIWTVKLTAAGFAYKAGGYNF